MGARKSRCAVDAAAIMADNIKFGAKKRLRVVTLFMDVKGAFDYFSRIKLTQ